MTYRKSNTLCARVHALHVHVRSEHRNSSISVPVGLQAFKESLRIVEDSGARSEHERAVWNGCGDNEA